jgi:pimeloyl-ACP methyl ester carboxylesterase
MTPERERTEIFRGLATSWWEAGDPANPILLFLHGFPDSPETWEAQVAYFRERYHVICPFARGAGPSEESDELSRYGTDASALDMLQLLAKIDPSGQRPVWIVGHDLGAVHAWSLAPLLGSRLRGVALINGLGLAPMLSRWKRPKQHGLSWYIYAMQIPGLAETMIRLTPQRMLALAHRLGTLPLAQRPDGTKAVEWTMHPLRQYRQFVREIPRTALRQLPRLQAPLLLLWGSRDAFLLPPTKEEWETFASDVTTRILPAGHWVHREKAAEVNRLLGGFFGNSPGKEIGQC